MGRITAQVFWRGTPVACYPGNLAFRIATLEAPRCCSSCSYHLQQCIEIMVAVRMLLLVITKACLTLCYLTLASSRTKFACLPPEGLQGHIFLLQSQYLHDCEYWNARNDKCRAYKSLEAMLKADPEKPIEMPFSAADGRLWGHYNIDGPNARR